MLCLYFTRTGLYPENYPDAACKASTKTVKHDPPLLFNLNYDPGELNPLNTVESPYNDVVKTINEVGYIQCTYMEVLRSLVLILLTYHIYKQY